METANPSTTTATATATATVVGVGSEGSSGTQTAVVSVGPTATAAAAVEDAAAKVAHKRYEALVTVKSKAIKGKGAWYWAHLEPILVHSADTGLPKSVKLRCALCNAVFSASNPSRTASEHLKRGTCPNFASSAVTGSVGGNPSSSPAGPKPLASIAPCSTVPPSAHHHHHRHGGHQSSSRKRSSSTATPSPPYNVAPLALLDPYSSSCTPPQLPAPPTPHQQHQQQLVLSGGKEDLGALAMLEDSVKKLKSPKASPGPVLTKAQAESALSLLSEWVHESCAAVSLSALSHPKFRTFLNQVGLPSAAGHLQPRELAGTRLELRFREALLDSDARLRDAAFFQLASHGWNACSYSQPQDAIITIATNLPNGTTVFRKSFFTATNSPPSKYAEEILWDAAVSSFSGSPQRCVGIVADRFKSKALKDLENQHPWLVNLPCQLQALHRLLKDFSRDLPMIRSAAAACFRLVSFFNSNPRARSLLHKYQLQELDQSSLLFSPSASTDSDLNPETVFAMLDDVLGNARLLQLVAHDETYNLPPLDEPDAREMADRIRDVGFWTELESVHSLFKLLTTMARELEAERPLVGQCLPLWEDLRAKVRDWCNKYNVDHGAVEKVIDRRFRKNYHPAWSAAFILDPLYLIKDSSGKYLPPFKLLTAEQVKDVDKLIMRLVSREEAHIALNELLTWRAEGLDPVYAQAVKVKQLDPATGKMRIANPQSSRLVWETCLSEFKALGKVAVRLIFLHATSCGFKCNSSLLRWVTAQGRSRTAMDRAQKIVFIAAQAKLDQRDFSSEEEKDAELLSNEDDDMLTTEAFGDASSV